MLNINNCDNELSPLTESDLNAPKNSPNDVRNDEGEKDDVTSWIREQSNSDGSKPKNP